MSDLLYENNEWDLTTLHQIYDAIDSIDRDKYRTDHYHPQIEILSSKQMIEVSSTIGLPVYYSHWSFGRNQAEEDKQYTAGKTGLAYECVINSDPCIAFCQENNNATMQALVIAHSIKGHGHFFKNNYLFKDWTNPSLILPFLEYARDYIRECEEKYGESVVTMVLDDCHSLQSHSIFKYPHKHIQEKDWDVKQMERYNYYESHYDPVLEGASSLEKRTRDPRRKKFNKCDLPQENLLYFVEKHMDIAEWKKEICRIVRKMGQYFYPQSETKVMNEGFASFMHYHLMFDLYHKGRISSGNMIEFLKSHTNVVNDPGYQYILNTGPGINPYYLGFNIFMDIKRICRDPDDEDYRWFPELAGCSDWLGAVKWAVENFKDSSFIRQYLSPKVMKKLGLFTMQLHACRSHYSEYEVMNAHTDEDFENIREVTAKRHRSSYYKPSLEVIRYVDRSKTIVIKCHTEYDLGNTEDIKTVLHKLARLTHKRVKFISHLPEIEYEPLYVY